MSTQDVQFTMNDGTVLAGLLSDPPGPAPPTALCIVAHPWARMGGTMRDHVVGLLARTILEQGARVIRFNARGAQPGTRATWTGTTEAEDYQAVIEASCRAFAQRWPEARGVHLVLAGYSAGAVHASFAHIPRPAPAFMQNQSGAQATYLLVSYPLGVLWALHLTGAAAVSARLDALVQEGQDARVLFIYGDGDQFTGVGRYDRLARRLADSGPTFRPVRVEGTDHFWGAREPAQRLVEAAAAAVVGPATSANVAPSATASAAVATLDPDEDNLPAGPHDVAG